MMFVGHYAAALAAKAVQPKAPFWTYVLGAQLVDVAWAGLVLAGVEKMSLDPHLPGSPLVLSHMPYTHSLPAVAVWALAAGLAARFLLKLPRAAAIAVGLVVLSHWGLDFLVHRPDLPLGFGGPKVGLGWWNHPDARTGAGDGPAGGRRDGLGLAARPAGPQRLDHAAVRRPAGRPATGQHPGPADRRRAADGDRLAVGLPAGDAVRLADGPDRAAGR
jgi:hypothetical protein